jgi:uncharacterized circularly permuted ATP-grasp superfamily protein/uncharacterized alpha-E superfamily protein
MTPAKSSPASSQPAGALLRGYAHIPGAVDVAIAPDGAPRPHWQPFLRGLSELSVQSLEHRREHTKLALDDSGMALLGSEHAQESPRPWQLDTVAFQLDESSFMPLQSALAQRATLLEAVVRDVLGPMRCLRERWLPPGVLFANPTFHRAYCDLYPSGGRYITIYAADTTQDAKGNWCVTRDRTQAPSGLGFALENRYTASSVHADLFRTLHVRRLAPFFSLLAEALSGLAPRNRENPRIVLLSEGSSGHRGFEDVYLARYLGIPRVEGWDLAARQGKAVLKTLGGALPVDVIFRRIPDDEHDPVELRGDSVHGVAGLLECLRQGNAALANALGCQLVESPALLPYLERLCKALLGQDLALPSLRTWWCGEPSGLAHVLANLQSLVVRPAFSVGGGAVDPRALSAAETAELVAALRAQPERYCGQERLERSTTAAMVDGRLSPRYWSLRVFLVTSGRGFSALPGGLARVSEGPDFFGRSGRRAVLAQDVWVSSAAPIAEPPAGAPYLRPVELRRAGAELPSRVADNLYWLGRSLEQAEGIARVLRAAVARVRGETEPWALPEVRSLVTFASSLMQLDAEAGVAPESGAQEFIDWLGRAALEPGKPQNLRGLVAECVRLAQSVRDRISGDAWRVIQRLDRDVGSELEQALDASSLMGIFHRLLLDSAAFAGLMSESVTRTLGWSFLNMGRRLERAQETATLLMSSCIRPGPEEPRVLEAVLDACDSMITYRSRYLASLQPMPMLDLLLTDDTNPRSLVFQLAALQAHINELPRGAHSPLLDPVQRLVMSLVSALRLCNPEDLAHVGSDGRREVLDRLLRRVLHQVPELDQALTSQYLVHAGLPRQFSALVSGALV